MSQPFQINFLIIGAQKAGTSALASFLAAHPEICHSPKKELHFFDAFPDYEATTEADIASAYRAAFPNFGGEALVGESTPIYLFLPHVARRIHRYNPAMKLIILLRDPVARAISHYQMRVNLGRERLSMAAAFLCEFFALPLRRTRWEPRTRARSYLARGFYSRQIRNLLRYFDRNQILILRQSELAGNQAATLRKVYDFLGVNDRSFIAPAALVRSSTFRR